MYFDFKSIAAKISGLCRLRHAFIHFVLSRDQVLTNDNFSVYLSLLSYPLIYYPGGIPHPKLKETPKILHLLLYVKDETHSREFVFDYASKCNVQQRKDTFYWFLKYYLGLWYALPINSILFEIFGIHNPQNIQSTHNNNTQHKPDLYIWQPRWFVCDISPELAWIPQPCFHPTRRCPQD